ncbi:MAG TPA: ribokinase [Xanthomonadaceae bacterium]|nr:ribokinase [Xanthomonadaceae bacterium]
MIEPPEVVVVGSYVQDHAWFCDTFPRDGESRRANGFNTGPGGKGFNQAIACHRQGVGTVFVGAIGDDHLGRIAQDFAGREGLDARWQIVGDAPTAASSILVDARGANRIVVNLGANERLEPAFVCEQLAGMTGARIVLCQLENGLDTIAAALDAATACGALRILNPAPMHPSLDPAMLGQADILTPNETEFALLCRHCGRDGVDPDALAALDDASLHALARSLPVRTVVITLGAHGCFVSHAQTSATKVGHGDAEPFYRIAPEAVRAIDSTGAGDAFNGALAAALLRFDGEPFVQAVRHANRAAALSTETIGTAPAMPTFAAVVARFGHIHASA